MSQKPPSHLREKLYSIIARERAIHNHPWVLRPRDHAPFSATRLFAAGEESFHVLELGAGWGEFCVEWLQKHPHHSYTAFEVKPDRIRRLLRELERHQLEGARIIPVNFNWFLEELLPPHSYDLIIVNFPDPWPKKRHWKHRLVDDSFPGRVAGLLRPGGSVYLATDYGPYARKMLGIFRRAEEYEPVFPPPHYRRARPEGFPPTRFEGMHEEVGRVSYYQEWRVKGSLPSHEKNREKDRSTGERR